LIQRLSMEGPFGAITLTEALHDSHRAITATRSLRSSYRYME
jgi:hypothetical protein